MNKKSGFTGKVTKVHRISQGTDELVLAYFTNYEGKVYSCVAACGCELCLNWNMRTCVALRSHFVQGTANSCVENQAIHTHGWTNRRTFLKYIFYSSDLKLFSSLFS